MQEEPVEAGRTAPRRAAGVHGVAGHGMVDGRQVDADLVGPPGDEVQLQERPQREALADAVSGGRRAPVRHDGHPRAVVRVAADGRLDPPHGRRRCAGHEGQVGLLDPAGLELGHQGGLGAIVLGDHQQAAGVAVQAVHDAGAGDPGDAPVDGAGAPQQGVDERAGGMAGAGVRDQAGRLVDHQQVLVLVHDGQVDGLAEQVGRQGRRDLQADGGARGEDRVGAQRAAIARDVPGRDQALDVRPAQAGGVRHEAVRARAGGAGGHGQRGRLTRHPSLTPGASAGRGGASSAASRSPRKVMAMSPTMASEMAASATLKVNHRFAPRPVST